MSAEMIAYPEHQADVLGERRRRRPLRCSCSEKQGQRARPDEARGAGRGSVLTVDPWHERDLVMPDVNTLHAHRGEAGLREGRRRPGRHRPDRAARLLRDRGDPALREPRHLRRRRGRQADRRRRDGARRPHPGERLGRPALQGPSARRDRHRQHLRGVDASARRSRQPPGQGAQIGLAHVIGLGTACAIHILEKVS